jgi:hypothetical protein
MAAVGYRFRAELRAPWKSVAHPATVLRSEE